MTGLQNAPDDVPLDSQAREHLQRLLLRVCLFRLFFLVLLLLPLGLAWLAAGQQREYLGLFLEPAYTGFLVSGFGLTLFFLLSWSYFQSQQNQNSPEPETGTKGKAHANLLR